MAPKTLLKRLLFILILACVAMSLFAFGAFLLFQHTPIRQASLDMLTEIIHKNSGWKVEWKEINGYLPFQMQAKRVTLTKENGSSIIIEEMEGAVSPLSIFRGRLSLSYLTIKDLHVRQWTSEESEKTDPGKMIKASQTFSPPFRLHIDHWSVHHFQWLDGNKKKEDDSLILYGADGSFDMTYKKIYLLAHLYTHEEHRQESHALIEWDDYSDHMSLKATLRESQSGFLSQILSLSQPFSSTFKWVLDKRPDSEVDHKGEWEWSVTTSANDTQRTPFFHAKHLFQVEGFWKISSEKFLHITNIEGKLFPDTPHEAQILGFMTCNSEGFIQQGMVNLEGMYPASFTKGSQFGGQLDLSCRLSGQWRHPQIELLSKGHRLRYGEWPIENFSSKITLVTEHLLYEGTCEAQGKLANIPFHLSSRLDWGSQKWELQHAEITLAQSILKGHLSFSTIHHLLTGEIEGEVKNLVPFSTLIQAPLHGKLKLKALFDYDLIQPKKDEEHLSQKVSIEFEGNELDYHDAKIAKLTGKLYLRDPLTRYKGHLALQAFQITQPHAKWEKLECQSEIDQELIDWPFSVALNGFWKGESQVIMSGSWRLTQSALQARVDVLNGTLSGQPLLLVQSSHFYIDGNEMEWEVPTLNLGKGVVKTRGLISPQFKQIQGFGRDLPVAIPNLFLFPDVHMEGTSDFDVQLQGKDTPLLGNVHLKFSGLEIHEEIFGKITPFAGLLNAQFEESGISLQGTFTNESHHPFQVEGQLPAKFFLSPMEFEISTHAPLSLKVRAEGELSSLLELLVTDHQSITGYAKTDFEVAGSWEKPEIYGMLTLQNGTYEDMATGATFHQIQGRVRGNQSQLILENLTAQDPKGGSLQIQGTLELDMTRKFPFTCQMHIQDATLVHLDYAEVVAEGDLTVTGHSKKGTVAGNLTLTEGTFSIPEESPPQLKTVDVTYVNLPPPLAKLHGFQKREEKWPLDLNIIFHIPGKAYVKGRDLKSEWQGEITVKGTLKDPSIKGDAQVIQGEYDFNGRIFTSQRGNIHFVGDPKKTTLYITAEQDIEDTRVEMILKGPISDPVLSFRSNPPMNEKDILSLVLFNRTLADITPLQGAQLSHSVFTLSQGEDKPDLLSKIRNSIGIDRVDISSQDTEDMNDVSISVGKYISRGVFVSLNKSINSDTNRVAIEARVWRHWKVQGEVGDNSEGKLSLKWEKDY